jgi:putative peptidoglycan lipid II flippase
VIIPIVIKKFKPDELGPTQKFLEGTFTAFCFVMAAVSAIAFFIIPLLKPLVVPGFTPAAATEWVTLSRIILWSPFLLGLSNLVGSFTQSFKKFFVYALSPIFYNIGNILGIAVFYPWWGLSGLAWGIAVGALMHFAIQLPTLYRSGLWLRLTRNIDWPELRRVVLISLPRTLTLSASQFVILILVALASLMAEGSITVFNFAYSLQSIPLMIIGVSYSVAAFPTLVKLFSEGNRERFLEHISRALANVLFWSIPATILFVVLRAQIVRVTLGAGNFSWSDTRLTAAALALFVVSAVGQGLVLLFVRGYYAGGITRKPLIVNLSSSLAIVLLAYGLHWLFGVSASLQEIFHDIVRVRDVSGAQVLVLPLAFSLGSLANAIIFWFSFERDFGPFTPNVRRSLWQIIYARHSTRLGHSRSSRYEKRCRVVESIWTHRPEKNRDHGWFLRRLHDLAINYKNDRCL